MARQRRTGRPCKFETLETRNLLAGDVTASIHSGDLVIKGDDLANGITITAGATAGSVVITGVNAGGSATNVNGTANGAVTLSGFTDDLKISMKSGDDIVTITNLDVSGKAKIKGGDGNDTITIDGLTVDGELKTSLGDGDDTLSITDSDVTGKTRIKGKSGDDDVTIEDSTFTKLRNSLGHGDDTLDISGTTVSVKTRLNGGHGTNAFTNGTGNSLTNLKEKNFGEDGDDSESSTTPSETSAAPTLALSGAATANEGSPYTLSLNSSGNGASSISQWTINWGDGSAVQTVTGNPSSVTHTFADGAGTRTISATATNSGGTTNAGNTVSVTVGNVAPTLSISGPASINEGTLYTLNLSSSDPGTDTISQWTINWGDGSAVQTVTGNPSSVTHTFTDGPATRTIGATATDEDGTFNAGNTVTVTVNNVAPAVAISGASSVNEGALYTLNLSATDPGADTISQWVINWGDGSAVQSVTGNPSSVTHTFADGPVTRTISATATDEDGTVNATNIVSVTVVNVVPTLGISGASTAQEGTPYTLNLSSSDPGADTITQWTINWGDNTPTQVVTGNPSSVTHTFADGVKLCTIIATATDDDSTFATTSTLAVIVDNISPGLSISGASSIDEGSLYTLHLSSSDPGADAITNWTINWGDGTPLQTVVGNPSSVTHTFADGAETRTISATATDEDGTFNAGNTVVVTVNNVAPTLSIDGATESFEGALYNLSLSSSDPGADTIAYWTINWGDGAEEVVNGNPTSWVHYYSDGPNDYTASATATDEDGTYAAGNTVSVTVKNVPPTTSLSGPSGVYEGSFNFWTLGTITFDPGADQVTDFIVHWGDGDTQPFPAGQLAGSGLIGHQYDEGPNAYAITVDLVDEDGTYVAVATWDVTVNNSAPGVSLDTPQPNDENSATTLTGSFTDPDVTDAQTVTIDWGDPNSSALSTFALPPSLLLVDGNVFNSSTDETVLTVTSVNGGTVAFSVQHTYLDDGAAPGDGVEANSLMIQMSVTDDDGDAGSAFNYAFVHDVAATLQFDPFPDVPENDFLVVTGAYTDVSLLDGQTLMIYWSDPSGSQAGTFQIPGIQDTNGAPLLSVGQTIVSTSDDALLTITSIDNLTGRVGFSTKHQYLDDGLSPGDGYSIYYPSIYSVITGDDSPTAAYFNYGAVHDLAPTVSLDPVADASEGDTVTVTGKLADVGRLDAHTLAVQWSGQYSAASTFNLAAPALLEVGSAFGSYDSAVLKVTSVDLATGEVGFSITYRYPDNGASPGNEGSSDTQLIIVTVTDDDGLGTSDSKLITISNVAPTVVLDPIPSITEGSVTITGSFTDPGIRDAHTININWGDPNDANPSSFALPPMLLYENYQAFYPGSSFYSYSSNVAGYTSILTVTSVDISTGTVGFLVQRQYLDDGPAPGNGTESDIVTVDVTVTDDDGASGSAKRFLTVNNAAPTVALGTLTNVSENSQLGISGAISDVGLLDAHALTIHWGDPNAPDSTFAIPALLDPAGNQNLDYFTMILSSTDNAILTVVGFYWPYGQISFTTQHKYLDDGLAPGNGSDSDVAVVSATVVDDDGASSSDARFVTIFNSAPSVALPSTLLGAVNNSTPITGSYSDAGLLDAHTLAVAWGDATTAGVFAIPSIRDAAGTLTLAVGNTFNSSNDDSILSVTSIDATSGQVGFSVQHVYTSPGTKTINVSVADDDFGSSGNPTTILVF